MPLTPIRTPVLIGAGAQDGTVAVLVPDPTGLPRLVWTGPARPGLDPAQVAAVRGGGPRPDDDGGDRTGAALLPEASRLWLGRPGLAGYRHGGEPAATGRDWATAFVTTDLTGDERAVRIEAVDERAGLHLLTEIEACPGGVLQTRHTLTNTAPGDYVVDHLEVVYPVADRVAEVLDLTGRWARERSPQRHPIADGLWLREGRAGRPHFDSPTVLVAGTAGFGFGHGLVHGLHVAWSGNSRYALERLPSGLSLLRGGELLLPGELVLAPGERYTTPKVLLAVSADGLDGLAAQWHEHVRALPAHPGTPRPVVYNVWEATYFDHDLDRLTTLADLAAEVGVERFVLDDGWFGGRRDDTSGLGDWYVSPDVWPDGLGPLVERVAARGMQFGLWFEPEMVNPDSELYRAHPDWVLSIGDRPPRRSRHQLVLDLGREDVRDHLFARIDAVLREYPIRFVKWDHNRPLTDAGSTPRADAPGVHAATLGFYALLDRLRAAHPDVEWESCASGGGRIDLGVIERVERCWTSDMTDALSRQLIQRWTGQLVPPEYLGSHVSAPVNHQTGRRLSLDFRAATAFFGSMGIEWDLTAAGPQDLARLAEWIAEHRRLRGLLHSGRTFRGDTTQPAVYTHGVVARDARAAVVAYVQLDDQVHEPEPLRVPGLPADQDYVAHQLLPPPGAPPWRGEGARCSGALLADVGLPAPARGPETIMLVHLTAV
ncbi:alpha-galactosidase [Dactylosporangium aurantiacum]|uniref:alpha-galactosidase n=1 Tax=Dactylosporangium aurantiacum TaxID=35754 RepID=A0A9Q9IFL5_9ACTN|nr:alpha-galactosidase [Dactylosporangium aurantiacum]MDG6101900.1 alpha-galactosidase [Dactylosporangium aurantiacum]UWZ52303.1 alpha-galactosidase [Dactylosporangium aurantiacum]